MKELKTYANEIKQLMELIEMDIEDEEDLYLIKSHFENAHRKCSIALDHIWIMENEED